jgi:hypothetical protein
MDRNLDATPDADDEREPVDEEGQGDAAEDLAQNEDLVDQEPGSAVPGDDAA